MSDQLPGQLAYVFLIAILDATLLSVLALRWYGRSVRRLMREADAPQAVRAPEGPARESDRTVPPPGVPAALAFAVYHAASGRVPDARVAAMERVGLGRVVLAYAVGAALYSAVVTVAWFGSGWTSVRLVQWFAVWWVHAWPIVPTLVALLVLDRRGALGVAAGYMAIGALALALLTLAGQVARGAFTLAPVTNAYNLGVELVVSAFAPLSLVLLTGWRRVRAVMPLALASTLLFGFGSLVSREALVRGFNHSSVRTAVLGLSVITSANLAYYALFMIAALPIGWLAWRLLKGVAGAYAHKQFSNVQLVIDCWWLIATGEIVSAELAPSLGLASLGIGIAALVAYRLGVAAALRGALRRDAEEGQRLLLLRVFGYQARTELLFDRIAERWRFHGPVRLIAGADLAIRAIDPGDMLAFLSGHLGSQYIASADQLPERVNALDGQRDPDGRYRVSELFCHEDTWRPSLQALLDSSDAALMDLRSFSRRNAGCVFELEQIVSRLPTDKIVLVCDRTTDLTLLRDTLDAAWDKARREGHARGSGQLAIVPVERHSRRELGVLMGRLFGVPEPSQVLAAPQRPG
jgi:hypothetical protein